MLRMAVFNVAHKYVVQRVEHFISSMRMLFNSELDSCLEAGGQ